MPQSFALLSIAFCTALLAACGDRVESEFMSGCASTSALTKICKCVYRRVEPDLKKLKEDGAYLMDASFNRRFNGAMQACAKDQ